MITKQCTKDANVESGCVTARERARERREKERGILFASPNSLVVRERVTSTKSIRERKGENDSIIVSRCSG